MGNYDEPLKDYATYYRDHHARNVSEHFEDLLRQSGVDEQFNIQTVSELRQIESEAKSSKSNRTWWQVGRIAAILGVIALGFAALSEGGIYLLLLIPAAGLGFLVWSKINPRISALNEDVTRLEEQQKAKLDEAWLQMAPLNALHNWNTARSIFQKTFPEIVLDPYVTNRRLSDLLNNYGLSPTFTDGRSILFAQGGSLSENPFAVIRYIQHWMGTMTYQGQLMIYWTEYYRDSDGNTRSVQKSQLLTATVVKPYPEYGLRAALVYGHEAAPNLSFSRTPSKLSGAEDGVINNWKKGHALRKVEKQARKDIKSGTGQFTVMSNRDFEILFNATDRDDELEFRLLFTPLAQQEIVNLLNDKTEAFGDNFYFVKQGRTNILESEHLVETELGCNPAFFHTYDLQESRSVFNKFHNDFFKGLYFALAPIFAIPLYREARSIPKVPLAHEQLGAAFVEHEAMANLIGEGNFRHPESVTHNILKTRVVDSDGRVDRVQVTAYGYAGIPRVDIIPVYGGDGNWHQVPVNWTEYIPVHQDSTITVGVIDAFDPHAESPVASNVSGKTDGSETFDLTGALVRGPIAAWMN